MSTSVLEPIAIKPLFLFLLKKKTVVTLFNRLPIDHDTKVLTWYKLFFLALSAQDTNELFQAESVSLFMFSSEDLREGLESMEYAS